MNEHWRYENIRGVHLELSTFCNSICPWCPRYNNFSPNLGPDIIEDSYTLERFKRYFPIDFVKQVNFWTFAGDYGDPCTAKEIIPILKHIFKHNDSCGIQINTNGGMKPTGFWHELGMLFKGHGNRYVIFSVDGLEDTNHIYRRNVKWNKVINAMNAYANTGARGIWEFLKFKHNEHQISIARAMAGGLGFQIRFKNPNGFEGEPMPARDKDYNIEYLIHPSSDNEIPTVQEGVKRWAKIINDGADYEEHRDIIETLYKDKPGCVECSANHTFGGGNEIRINVDGTVWPCSFFGHLSRKYLKNRVDSVVHQFQMKDVFKDIKNNLEEQTLKEILDSDPFRKVYTKWPDKKLLLCYDACGKHKDKTQMMEKIYASAIDRR